MNERINELLKQSRTEYWTQYTPSYDYEKFAELIVRECMLQVADVRIENDFEQVGDAVLVKALAGIRQYFGVE